MKTILVVFKKELKRYFTDKRMLMGLILPGLLIFLIYSLMGEFMMDMVAPSNEYNIAIVNNPLEFRSLQEVEGWIINVDNIKLEDKEENIAKLKEEELDLIIIYEEDFYDKMMSYDGNSSMAAPNIEIYFDSASTNSAMIYEYYQAAFQSIESSLVNKFNINSLGDIYDVSSLEDMTAQIMTMILPFLFVTLLFSGCMSVCSESIAGEKERGTIATLLVTPVKRSYLAIGKVVALSVTALVSAVSSFIGLMASLPKLMGGELDFSTSVYDLGTYISLLVVIISTVLIFTVILTMISTFAKSVKEASSYAIPVMIIVMVCGFGNFMSTTASSNPLLYLIPIFNSVQCITGVLSMSVDPLCFVVAIVANLIYFSLGIFILTRMFNSEKIMFQK